MIKRRLVARLERQVDRFSAVGIIGSRQVGKTTLAKTIAKNRQSVYLDLENPDDLIKLENPVRYFTDNSDYLIILDEIQRKPEIFPVLRSVIDQNREQGQRNGQFLILGSASVELLRQASESLAGRIVYEELPPITLTEYNQEIDMHWIRGGYPDSLTAAEEEDSLEWRRAFITSYLERDIPFFGPRIPATTMRRLWTMLAHNQGTQLNASQIAAALSVSVQSVTRYVDLLADLFLVRRLQPWHKNTSKRLTKSPRVYVSDSGILHSLLKIHDKEALLSHPIVGHSWEGYVIANLLGILPSGCETYYYRSSGGAEIDLIIEHANGKRLAIEIKKSSVPKLERGFFEACKDVEPDEKFVVYQGEDSFYMKNDVLAIGLEEMMGKVE